MIGVPSNPDQATPSWFTSVLRAEGVLGPDAEVVDVKSAEVGNGLVGMSIRFELSYRGLSGDTPPASVVGKFPTTDPAYRAAASAELVYQRELLFYRTLAPTLDVRTPGCVHIAQDGSDFVLLLEDLGPAVGGDQIAGCTLARAESAMDAAVGLHAPAWGAAGLEDTEWNMRGSWLPRVAVSYPELFKQFAAAFADRLSPEDLAIGEAFAPVVGAWFAGQPKPWTVMHGDFRLDNMLFDILGGAEPIGVLDWQTINPGPGTADVSYFIGGCLPSELRRPNEQRLLLRYHDGLLAAGVRDYSWEQCQQDYRYNAFLGYFMASYSPLLVRRSARGDTMFATWLSRAAEQIRDLNALELLEGLPRADSV
ncbi:MAG TPA: phosphotransferase [Pseudonocardia sp.]